MTRRDDRALRNKSNDLGTGVLSSEHVRAVLPAVMSCEWPKGFLPEAGWKNFPGRTNLAAHVGELAVSATHSRGISSPSRERLFANVVSF